MTYPYHLPLCLLLYVQGFHPSDPSVWAKGIGLTFSRGGTELVLDFLPFLAMVSTAIVALHLLLSSCLGLLST